MDSAQGMAREDAAPIRIAAGIVVDRDGRMLLVRKRDTRFFIQPGGKLHDGETALEALTRELKEELGCTLENTELIGVYRAPAANEPMRIVEATLYAVEIAGKIAATAEIEEIVWVDARKAIELPLAPLTRDYVVPWVEQRAVKS